MYNNEAILALFSEHIFLPNKYTNKHKTEEKIAFKTLRTKTLLNIFNIIP